MERALVAQAESVAEDETILSIASGPFTANQLIAQFQQSLASWAIYHDVHVHKDALVRQPIVARLERRVEADGQNLIAVLHTLYSEDRDFKSEVNIAMRAAFGDDYEELVFPPAADQKVQLRIRWKSLKREQSVADLSDGTLRFLLLLAVLASPVPPPVIAIDEPETGLHPTMMAIVAEYAIEASRKSQIILTTHSPEFLDAFKETRPTTTVAKWSDGETTLTTVGGDDLEYWLREYNLGSLFRSGELENAG
jgi:predicted ATPase